MNRDNSFPISLLQQTILESDIIYPKLLINNISVFLIYEFSMDMEILNLVLNQIVKNNSALSTKILNKKNTYYQKKLEHDFINFKRYNFQNKSEEHIQNEFEKFGKEKIHVFDKKLFDFNLVILPNNKTGVFIKTHHIISDSWSVFLLEESIYNCYHKLAQKEVLFKAKPDYLTYIETENQYLTSPEFKRDNKYWLGKTSEYSVNNIFSRKYFDKDSNEAKRLVCSLSSEETKVFSKFCNEFSASKFIVALSIFCIYLNKTTNFKTFSIFTPVYNRKGRQEKDTIGLFVNTLPFFLDIDDSLNIFEFIKNIKKDFLSFLRHSRYPNHLIFEKLSNHHEKNRNIQSIFFSFENTSVNKRKIKTTHFFGNDEISNLSIHISNRDANEELKFEIDYKTSFFSEKEITDAFLNFKALFINIQKAKNKSISDIELISPHEKKVILHKFNQPINFDNESKTIVDLFDNIIDKNLDKTAIIFNNKNFSYEELSLQSNYLAEEILDKLNFKSNSKVLIALPRSEKLIISVIAVLKAGCICVPADINLPENRLNYILSDSKAELIITDSSFVFETSLKKINIENNRKSKKVINNSDINNYASLFYTSGTTGKPKGITTKHKAYSNLIYSYEKKYGLSNIDINLLQLASFHFDVFIGDLLKVIPNAGTIIIASEDEKLDPKKLCKLIENHKVSIIESTPGLLFPLFKHIENSNSKIDYLKKVIFGSDSVSNYDFYKLVIKNHNRIEFYNSYGVTESSVESTSYLAKVNDKYESQITPIGYPLENIHIYILNKNQQLLPIGIEGEIYISGLGNSNEYLNDKILSSQKFITNPFLKNVTMYKTGDRARWLNDGNIEFLGRNDNQIKIRGFRVELFEIEACIKQIKDIENVAVVIDEKSGSKRIIAFIVSNNQELNSLKIQRYLKKDLPNYMIPSEINFITKIPLSQTGKIDRKQLQKSILPFYESYSPPLNNLEKKIEHTLCKLLKIEKLSREANFFNIGFDSLLVMQAVVKLGELNINLNAQDFYEYPSIRKLSGIASSNEDSTFDISKYKIDIATPNLEFKTRQLDSVLLTGATGFLGIHLLNILSKNNITIFCLVRSKNNQSTNQRLSKLYKFYFNVELPSNVKIIEVDERKSNFEIEKITKEIINQFNIVIHSASNVNHVGEYSTFEKVNVKFTQELIELCKKENKELHYISTISLSGETKSGFFCETDFEIPHNLKSNPYIKSKFFAEVAVRDAIKDDLNATIYRIGNLAGRLEDGVFQINMNQNTTYILLNSFMDLKVVPENILDFEIEFTPVDLCGIAITSLIRINESNQKVFHLFNNNKIKIGALVDILNTLDYKIKIVGKKEFLSIVSKSVINPLLSIIISEFEKNVQSKTLCSNDLTSLFLDSLNFSWNNMNKDYVKKVIDYINHRKTLNQKN